MKHLLIDAWLTRSGAARIFFKELEKDLCARNTFMAICRSSVGRRQLESILGDDL